MADHQSNGFADSDDEVSAEDLLDLLQSNTLAMSLATIRFLEERQIPVGEWVDALGAMFVKGWDLSEEWTPEDLLQAVLVNLASFGGEAVQAEYADDQATAVIERFPDSERVADLGLDNVNGDILLDLVRPIAAACGLDWSWRRDGERIVAEISRSRGHS
jgi:hypothetical protein